MCLDSRCGRLHSDFSIFPFFFFFFTCFRETIFTVAALFMGPTATLFRKNIKNGSHGTIHTFKNYFTTVFSVFSFSKNKLYLNGPFVPLFQMKWESTQELCTIIESDINGFTRITTLMARVAVLIYQKASCFSVCEANNNPVKK